MLAEDEDNKLRKPLFAGLFPSVVAVADCFYDITFSGDYSTHVQRLQASAFYFYVIRVWLYYWLGTNLENRTESVMRGRKV